ncbi:MAG: FecR domain-containing protein [Pseudobdellovibrio sp.]
MKNKSYLILLSIIFVSLSSFANEIYGLLMIVKGEVKITKSDNQTTDAKIGGKVFVQDTIVTGKDSRAKIVMSDRNIINVLPDTKLRISSYLNNGSEKNVRLDLIEGKVRNNVEQKYDNDKNKFEVVTPSAVAGVRGTQFITSFDKGTFKTAIITLKGEVSFRGIDLKTNAPTEAVVVKKGETSSLDQSSVQPEAPKKVPPVEFKRIENESVIKKESPNGADGSGRNANQPPPPKQSQVKNEIKQIISNIDTQDNAISDTKKQIINKPAKVKIEPQQQ